MMIKKNQQKKKTKKRKKKKAKFALIGACELIRTYEPPRMKKQLFDFRPGPTQTDMYSHRKELEA